jgi:hypothetical protein
MDFMTVITRRISRRRPVWPGLREGHGGFLGIALAVVLGVTVAPQAGAMIKLATPPPVARFHHAPGGNGDHASAAGASTFSGVLQDSLGNALAGARFNVWGADSNCDAGGPVASATTASDGSFSVAVSPGSYDIFTSYGGSTTDPAFGVCTQDVDLSSSVDATLTVPVTQLTVTVQDSSGNLLQGATVQESPEKPVEAGFDLIPGYPITAGDGYVETSTVPTGTAGTAVVPLMPLSSPLSLAVDPPTGSQLLPTTISTGLMNTNTNVTATLAGPSHHQTKTTLSSAPNPSSYGQTVTFTATVSPTDGQGTVSFVTTTGKYKLTLCPHQSLSQVAGSYQASCTTSSLAPGTHTVVATYSGDTNYSGSSATLKQTVTRAATATVISSSKNPSAYGQAVTFTATVSPTDGAGTMTFRHAGQAIPGCASEPLHDNAGSYQATCTTSALPGGTDKISAAYSGDKNYSASTATLSQVVNRAPTTTTLTSSLNPSTYGETVTFTATISPADGGGTMTFAANGTPIPSCTNQVLTLVSGSYTARCRTTNLPIGTGTIKTTYSGDATYQGSSSTVTQHVKPSTQAIRPQPASSPTQGRRDQSRSGTS